jgi:Cu-processing system ATP-binding protein
MIKIDQLYKSFGKKEVLKGIDLSIQKPGIYAVLGPNGSGKTTLIKCVLGMCIPDSGILCFQENNVRGKHLYRDQIDYLPQIAHFPENLKVRELLSMIKDIRKRDSREEELIGLFQLEPFLDIRLRNLSGGTRQRVNLVQALMYDNPVLILDEPTVGLDPLAIQTLKKLIQREKAKGKLIIITTHIMSFAEEMADNIIFLLEGNIHFSGELKTLMTNYNESNLEKIIAQIMAGDHFGIRGNGSSDVGSDNRKRNLKLL